MKYVALLRGINVGGRNKIEMSKLVKLMELAGFNDVSTYINSGNIFLSSSHAESKLTQSIEQIIHREFKLEIPVLLCGKPLINEIATKIPPNWQNDKQMKCDVMFLWDDVDHEGILNHLTIKHNVDTVIYVQGAIVWMVDRANNSKSGIQHIIGSQLYKKMTIRNLNTFREISRRLN